MSVDPPNTEHLLWQALQATDTLISCWMEDTQQPIEDNPYVLDAHQTSGRIRSELLSHARTQALALGLQP
jgi:hypothetical protein